MSPTQPRSIARHRIGQAGLLAAALAAAVALVWTAGDDAGPSSGGFDMLAYLDQRAAGGGGVAIEAGWSGFRRLQEQVAGMPIDTQAVDLRIERHTDLIQSIWDLARRIEPDHSPVSAAAVRRVLRERFGYEGDAAAPTAAIRLSGQLVTVEREAIASYCQTAEPWRLLQTWASHRSDERGRLTVDPPFGEAALGALHDFLCIHDAAVLRRAARIARRQGQQRIDAPAMIEAFGERTPASS